MSDRFIRQSGFLPTEKIQALPPVTVIGVGAVGRQVAIQLAALGVPEIHLIDPDKVEEHNITTQGYFRDDIQHAKVVQTTLVLERMDPSIKLDYIIDRWRSKFATSINFCCVDKIGTREVIFRELSRRQLLKVWVDGRMRGENIRVVTASESDPSTLDQASHSFFAQEEAATGTCTNRSTFYAACICAGLMVNQFTRCIREFPLEPDFMCNLLSGEMFPTPSATTETV